MHSHPMHQSMSRGTACRVSGSLPPQWGDMEGLAALILQNNRSATLEALCRHSPIHLILASRAAASRGQPGPARESSMLPPPPSCPVCSTQCTDMVFSLLCHACASANLQSRWPCLPLDASVPPCLVQSDRTAAAVLGQHGRAAAAESVLQWSQWACPHLLDGPAQPLCHVSVSLPPC